MGVASGLAFVFVPDLELALVYTGRLAYAAYIVERATASTLHARIVDELGGSGWSTLHSCLDGGSSLSYVVSYHYPRKCFTKPEPE